MRIKWVRQLVHMGETWHIYLNGRYHLEDKYVDERIILTEILKKQHVRIWAGFIWLGYFFTT
jgi:hypothetical protein